MRICIDLDGTLCTQEEKYEHAEPIWPAILWLYNQISTHKDTQIVVYTARHWDYLQLTEMQLRQWGVPYNALVMGKPSADIYIDDRAIPFPWETKNGDKET